MIDLHIHSTCSDGTDSPDEIVDIAMKTGLHAIALTDHDTLAGLQNFETAAKENNLNGVPGIELSTYMYASEVHILGLFIEYDSSDLIEITEKMHQWRIERSEAIMGKLRRLGYDISMKTLLDNNVIDASIGRPHIAAYMVKKGYFDSIQSVFTELIGNGKSCYVPRKYIPYDECIRRIRLAGGIAVWAHPYNQKRTTRDIRRFCKKMASHGLNALECYYSAFSNQQTDTLLKIANENHLLVTGGSDYHGTHKPDIKMGTGTGYLNVPDELFTNLKQYMKTAL